MICKSFIRKNFFFVHIPKTAGTSISSTIKNSYKYRVSYKPIVHSTALSIRNELGASAEKYYSFSFIRNPWDRLNSAYYFLCQKKLYPEKGENWDQQKLLKKGFKAWLMEESFWEPNASIEDPFLQIRPQSYYLCDKNNEMIVDDIFRYENLHNDLKNLGSKLGIDFKNLTRTKSTNRKDFREDYCSETIDFVLNNHRVDIDKFNYKFD
tara:strand:- start:231 stop:857 length:627 start_codon:yes stop_codon:yes gene_type:complete